MPCDVTVSSSATLASATGRTSERWPGSSPLIQPGGTALAMLSLLEVERFAIEFLRAKDDRFFGSLTLAQVISIGLVLLAGALWMRWRRGGGEGAEPVPAGGGAG